MGIASQLATIDRGFQMIAAVPELRSKPIVIGESDPEGCAACQGAQLGYRNGTMYSSYTAAVFARKHLLAAKHAVKLEGRVDVGVRVRGPELLRRLPRVGDQRESTSRCSTCSGCSRKWAASASRPRARPRCRSSASSPPGFETNRTWRRWRVVMAPRSPSWSGTITTTTFPGPDADVTLQIAGLPAAASAARITHFRVDETHSNAYGEWKRMGSPIAPNDAQYARLLEASRLATTETPTARSTGGARELTFRLPRQGVSLVVLDWSGTRLSLRG
jgi:xylan 1,4-beta-xylosidase